MGKEHVSNCDTKAPATKDDVTLGDNSFKCPVKGVWVELKFGQDGSVMCTKYGCNRWQEDPQNQAGN